MSGERNPFGKIAAMGGDWPEARSFVRSYGHEPDLGAPLAQTLIGFREATLESWQAASSTLFPDTVTDIDGTLKYFCQEFPDFLSDSPLELDGDSFFKIYPGCDPDLAEQVGKILSDNAFDSVHAEKEKQYFLRTYTHNPYAQERLAQTLISLLSNPAQNLLPNSQPITRSVSSKEAVVSITGVVRHLCQEFSEFLSKEPVEVAAEFNLRPYRGCSPLLKTMIDRTLERSLN